MPAETTNVGITESYMHKCCVYQRTARRGAGDQCLGHKEEVSRTGDFLRESETRKRVIQTSKARVSMETSTYLSGALVICDTQLL